MSTNYDKLKKLLAELFQLDQADLDFGIYRIMNQKRDEIVQFLDKDLLPQVKEAFEQYKSADKVTVKEELDKAIEHADLLGVNPDDVPKVRELRAKYEHATIDSSALENEVFSDLYNFFRRYYDKGDFISARRYKEGVYAIPYEGEEVKLYWANHDQYYIKTSEYFHNYSFKLPSGKRVCFFKLVEADVEKDNIKAEAGKERRFVLTESNPLAEENSELVVRFEYRADAKKRDQKTINQETVDTILKHDGFMDWRKELSQLSPTEKNPQRTLLEKHLTDYTARNTFDYFIHKDLRKFLQREEWIKLFAIDEIEGNLHTPVYSSPLTSEFLKANPFLVLDTKFFDQSFKETLLAGFDDLDEQCDGVLINSENFQALQFLSKRYERKINSIYIDPPYNTSASEILYKNDYKHSSWLSLIDNRVTNSKPLLTKDGIACITIDDEELHNLWFLIQHLFNEENYLGTALIRNNPQGRSTVKGFAVNHEYAIFFASSESLKSIGRLERTEKQNARYNEIDEEGKSFLWENFRKTGTDFKRNDRPKQYYPIYFDGKNIRIPEMEWNNNKNEWIILEEHRSNESVLWPKDDMGAERVWKWGHQRVTSNPGHIRITEGGNGDMQVYRRNYLNILGSLPGTWWINQNMQLDRMALTC